MLAPNELSLFVSRLESTGAPYMATWCQRCDPSRSTTEKLADERKQFSRSDLSNIPSVIKDFQFFAQPGFRIASARPGSGNTQNIGSVVEIAALVRGTGPFSSLGEEVYDDYWMFYPTRDMAEAVGVKRPYMNLKTYSEYKQRPSNDRSFYFEFPHAG